MGGINRYGRQKERFVSFVAAIKHLETKRRQFFTAIDSLVLFIARYNMLSFPIILYTMTIKGQTDHFTPCVYAQGNDFRPILSLQFECSRWLSGEHDQNDQSHQLNVCFGTDDTMSCIIIQLCNTL